MMRRNRRVNWTRVVLRWGFVFCLVCYAVMVTAIFLIDNGDGGGWRQELADTTAPVIELRGGEAMTMAVGDTLVEPGFVVYDTQAMPEVEVESEVDVTREGDYEIQYRASDGAGNVATVVRKVKVVQPAGRIYLTFDDGPSEYTGALLDILKKYGVTATFFVTGYGDDEVIRREYNEGHAVGLHTFTHNYAYLYASMENYVNDFNQVRERVQNITGKAPELMRFPGGSSNLISAFYDGGAKIMSKLVDEVSGWGYTYFDWNVDSDDAGRASTANEVYANVVNTLKAGGESVVLQHDTKECSVEAVERIIQYGLEHNYVFGKLSKNSFTARHGVNN